MTDLLLGRRAKDRITGFEGLITAQGIYLTGCAKAVLVPKVDAKGHAPESRWIDVPRLQIAKDKPVTLAAGSPGFSPALLGRKAKDRVTGFRGTITGQALDISGSDQLLLSPAVSRSGGETEPQWFDAQRLEIDRRTAPVTVDNSRTPGADRLPPHRW